VRRLSEITLPQRDDRIWPAKQGLVINRAREHEILDARNVVNDVLAGRIPNVDAMCETRAVHFKAARKPPLKFGCTNIQMEPDTDCEGADGKMVLGSAACNPGGTSFQERFSMSKLKFATALALLVAAAIATG
jgi:hypothetical protein